MKIRHFSLAASLVFAITLTLSCDSKEDKDKFTDSRDGKKYKTVTIGSQIWMAENLNYAAEGSVCYENNPDNCAKYGELREIWPFIWEGFFRLSRRVAFAHRCGMEDISGFRRR